MKEEGGREGNSILDSEVFLYKDRGVSHTSGEWE
jgi:hypothetical protein